MMRTIQITTQIIPPLKNITLGEVLFLEKAIEKLLWSTDRDQRDNFCIPPIGTSITIMGTPSLSGSILNAPCNLTIKLSEDTDVWKVFTYAVQWKKWWHRLIKPHYSGVVTVLRE